MANDIYFFLFPCFGDLIYRPKLSKDVLIIGMTFCYLIQLRLQDFKSFDDPSAESFITNDYDLLTQPAL